MKTFILLNSNHRTVSLPGSHLTDHINNRLDLGLLLCKGVTAVVPAISREQSCMRKSARSLFRMYISDFAILMSSLVLRSQRPLSQLALFPELDCLCRVCVELIVKIEGIV